MRKKRRTMNPRIRRKYHYNPFRTYHWAITESEQEVQRRKNKYAERKKAININSNMKVKRKGKGAITRSTLSRCKRRRPLFRGK